MYSLMFAAIKASEGNDIVVVCGSHRIAWERFKEMRQHYDHSHVDTTTMRMRFGKGSVMFKSVGYNDPNREEKFVIDESLEAYTDQLNEVIRMKEQNERD